VEVPAESDIPLSRLIVDLDNPGSPLPVVDLGKTSATVISANQAVPVEVTVSEGSGKEMIFSFSKPIAPGSTVNLQWTARNLRQPGTYLFDVNAFPTGTSPRGQFLGFARLNIGTYGGR
jgi:Protein of unknown function (DUF2808)